MFNPDNFAKCREVEKYRHIWPKALTRLLMVAAAAGGTGACGQQEKRSDEGMETIAAPAWAPSEYQWGSRQLPLVDFANDPSPFFTAFKNEWEELEKKEFETTEEFNSRMENERFASRFSKDALYAFPLLDVDLAYNADRESFESSDMSYICWWDTTIPNHAACPIGRTIDSSDRYRGKNAYGAAAEVEKTSGREFYLAVQRKNLEGKAFKRPLPFQYDLHIRCRMPIQEAKGIAGKDVKVIVVRSLRARELLLGVGSSETPTIGNPVEEHFETQAIPFEIRGFVCYDSATGAIVDTVKV